jgi:hypothetical protein
VKRNDEQMIVGGELATSRSSVRDLIADLGILHRAYTTVYCLKMPRLLKLEPEKCLSRLVVCFRQLGFCKVGCSLYSEG